VKTAQAAGAPAFNPYAAPTAAVSDAAQAGGQAVFFPVSLLKLSLMSLGTLGLYHIYWFYKNWKCVQQNDGENVNAPIRAFFYAFTAYPLFTRIRAHAERAQVPARLQAGMHAVTLFLFIMASRLPDPWWLAGLGAFLPLLPVQSAANEINRKLAPQADRNTRFSGWNVAAFILAGIVLVLGMIGTFFGE
jgi:hypothetical protein